MRKGIKNLGYQTDCIIWEAAGTVVEKRDCFVVRMPSNPTYHWGNLLLFKAAPRADDYGRWIAAHEAEFGAAAGHVTFGWDEAEQGETIRFQEDGFSLEVNTVLQLEGHFQAGEPRIELEIRRIDTDAEWEAVTDLQILVSEGEKASPEFIAFKQQVFQTYRKISDNGSGAWWGAFAQGRLVGDLGLFFDDQFEVGRFQSVETHPDFRRQGVCSYLLKSVIEKTRASGRKSELVICAKKGSTAAAIYTGGGFRPHTNQFGVSLSRPYEERIQAVRE